MRSAPTLALALMTLSLWSVGCSKTTTVTAPDGTAVTMQQDGSKMTVKTDKGTVVVDQQSGASSMTMHDGKTQMTVHGQQPIDLDKEFGLPGYPGATQEATVSQSGQDAVKAATLTTTDSYDKVAAFYKDKLGKVHGAQVTEVNTAEQKMLNITIEESARTINAMVVSSESGARIQLNSQAKAPQAKVPEGPDASVKERPAPAEADKPAEAVPAAPDAAASTAPDH
jgi:hypothetical protein